MATVFQRLWKSGFERGPCCPILKVFLADVEEGAAVQLELFKADFEEAPDVQSRYFFQFSNSEKALKRIFTS